MALAVSIPMYFRLAADSVKDAGINFVEDIKYCCRLRAFSFNDWWLYTFFRFLTGVNGNKKTKK